MFQNLEIFNVFPYLLIFVLVVIILQMGVGTKGNALQSDEREIVINVHKFVTDEFDALREGKSTRSFADHTKITRTATGISRSSVYGISNQKKDAESTETKIRLPDKKRPNTTPRKSKTDSFAAAAIKRTMYYLYKTSFVPSLPDIHKALTESSTWVYDRY
ncbi:hypothetical protein L9F63_024320 [Diploptera punctata]|uniref:Uncharacterized protein n=1 Tax=Diploptera punctata TaxID=6984 RepID=A0AAD7ZH86_DIPPU|nr:hypothetical protein L9F63_024320 [Diploptera punctata]